MSIQHVHTFTYTLCLLNMWLNGLSHQYDTNTKKARNKILKLSLLLNKIFKMTICALKQQTFTAKVKGLINYRRDLVGVGRVYNKSICSRKMEYFVATFHHNLLSQYQYTNHVMFIHFGKVIIFRKTIIVLGCQKRAVKNCRWFLHDFFIKWYAQAQCIVADPKIYLINLAPYFFFPMGKTTQNR